MSHDALVQFFQRYAEPEAPRQPLSIQDINERVKATDKETSDAYALLLLESGWIQAKDCSAELLERGAFTRFREAEAK